MSDESESSAASSVQRRPWLGAVASFAFPGLGQAYLGRHRLALLLGLPALVVVLLVIAVVTGIISGVRNSLLDSDVLVGVLVANGVLLIWRGIAIVEAGLVPWGRIVGHDRRVAVMVVASLLILTVSMHAWVGSVVIQLNETLGQVFAGEDPDGLVSETPVPSGETPDPSAQPAFGWDGTERVNVLLIGTDAAPGRRAVLTDVILVVSVDPVARTAVMISVPRDTGYVPMPDDRLFADGLFPDKVNAISARAALAPETWCPDLADHPEACGLRTIERSIGLYLGIEIHHFALIDMAGFADMIDALGGLELCLPGRLVDPRFDGTLSNKTGDGLVLEAGCRVYNGLDALAYARSRKGWIEMPDGTTDPQNDFDRAERQQQVLLAMRQELAHADTLLELPQLLRAIGRTVTTDFPRDRAGDLASLLPLITGPDIERIVLGYPDFVDLPVDPDTNYLLIPKRDAIRAEMERLFGADALQGWYLGSRALGPDGGAEALLP